MERNASLGDLPDKKLMECVRAFVFLKPADHLMLIPDPPFLDLVHDPEGRFHSQTHDQNGTSDHDGSRIGKQNGDGTDCTDCQLHRPDQNFQLCQITVQNAGMVGHVRGVKDLPTAQQVKNDERFGQIIQNSQ